MSEKLLNRLACSAPLYQGLLLLFLPPTVSSCHVYQGPYPRRFQLLRLKAMPLHSHPLCSLTPGAETPSKVPEQLSLRSLGWWRLTTSTMNILRYVLGYRGSQSRVSNLPSHTIALALKHAEPGIEPTVFRCAGGNRGSQSRSAKQPFSPPSTRGRFPESAP